MSDQLREQVIHDIAVSPGHDRQSAVALVLQFEAAAVRATAEGLTVGLTITSWPMHSTAYERGWNEALAAVRKRAALATPTPTEDATCGATHPEHPGTHCRREVGHSGEHATARRDVSWDNAYLSATPPLRRTPPAP